MKEFILKSCITSWCGLWIWFDVVKDSYPEKLERGCCNLTRWFTAALMPPIGSSALSTAVYFGLNALKINTAASIGSGIPFFILTIGPFSLALNKWHQRTSPAVFTDPQSMVDDSENAQQQSLLTKN